ncbi:hypothetical protein BDF21DRAFT_448050 [Thamnidium elegans]|nr:hypothetical protein BDF21DRAFT_448050 [Thamnidium elegans]
MSILTCTNTIQLSEFVAHMVPKIWTGSAFMTTERSNLFRIFCQNIIKATQISSPCILVALFYIYRLRFAYPAIRGSIGSETWSEVSSVPLHELNIMEMEFLSALQYRTCVHHIQFFSWSSQCQHWMSQLMARPVLMAPIMRLNKRSADHFPVEPKTKKKLYNHSVLSWSSSSYYRPSSAAAASAVATVAAATAMNVNYSNFIPRV